MEISLVHPDGTIIGPLEQTLGTQRYRHAGTQLLIYYGKPSPYSTSQEIYIDFLPTESYIDSGIWRIRLIPRRILQGEFSMWLPGGKTVGKPPASTARPRKPHLRFPPPRCLPSP